MEQQTHSRNQPSKISSFDAFGSSSKDQDQKSTISDFHVKYNVKPAPKASKFRTPKPRGSSSQLQNTTRDSNNGSSSSEDQDDFTYRIDLTDDKAYNNIEVGYLKTHQHRAEDFFDSLTTISKMKLQKLEEEQSLSKEEFSSLRVFKGHPVLEFNDYLTMTTFNEPGWREALNNNFCHFKHENLFIFNNVKSVVSLTLEIKTLSYLLKTVYTPRDGEFVSFVNVGTGKLGDAVFIGGVGSERIGVFDVKNSVRLFDVDVETDGEVMLNAVNVGNELFVALTDNKIKRIDVSCLSWVWSGGLWSLYFGSLS